MHHSAADQTQDRSENTVFRCGTKSVGKRTFFQSHAVYKRFTVARSHLAASQRTFRMIESARSCGRTHYRRVGGRVRSSPLVTRPVHLNRGTQKNIHTDKPDPPASNTIDAPPPSTRTAPAAIDHTSVAVPIPAIGSDFELCTRRTTYRSEKRQDS